jgi:UDP-N-acetyl-D-glucosamine dehydrogenase
VNSMRIAVIGLGYVGQSTARQFLASGHQVVGVDLKVNSSQKFEMEWLDEGEVDRLQLCHPSDLSPSDGIDVFLICVQTPLTPDGLPDYSFVIHASQSFVHLLSGGECIILQSTVGPGTTRNLIAPIFGGLEKLDELGISLAFSSERINPGYNFLEREEVVKIVGGVDGRSTIVASEILSTSYKKVIQASGAESVELSKLIENTYRLLNISFVNQLSIAYRDDRPLLLEAINLAATKPFGFQAFFPSAGAGGHCIPVDPVFLTDFLLKDRDFDLTIIREALQINTYMPSFVISQIESYINKNELNKLDCRIVVYGLSYKPGVKDLRNSSGLAVMEDLIIQGYEVGYIDGMFDEVMIDGTTFKKLDTNNAISERDVFVSFHPGLDELLAPHQKNYPVIDFSSSGDK